MTSRIGSPKQIILQTSATTTATNVACQMLVNAGYEIIPVASCEQACQHAAKGTTEMMILSGTHHEISAAMDRLAMIPMEDRPRHIAILHDDAAADDDALLARKLPGTKVHLLFRPLQAYGLLNVIRRIRGRITHAAN